MDKKILAVAAVVVVIAVVAIAAVAMSSDDKKDGVTEGVNYHGNGGTYEGKSVYGYTSHTVQSNQFTKSGSTFQSWNTKADGTGTTYKAGDNISYSSGSTVDLYAIWYSGHYLTSTTVGMYSTLTYNGSTLTTTNTPLPDGGSATLTLAPKNSIVEGSLTVEGDRVTYQHQGDARTYTYYAVFTFGGNTSYTIVANDDTFSITVTYDGSSDVNVTFIEGIIGR